MTKRTGHVELMAPAGSWEALSAALKAGADSVYFGIGQLNMRARGGENFGVDDLDELVGRCREAGVRSYLALNVLVYDHELDEIGVLLDAAKEAGVSAVIGADASVLQAVRSRGLELHISVQANVSNVDALRWYSQFADVVVPARELNLEQISGLCRAVAEEPILGPSGKPVRIELFAHGALCVAVSGQCSMSLTLCNKSANRGSCYQICRRKFRVLDDQTGEELLIDNEFVMSPRDLCTIRVLDRLIEAGVSVFKLEGRGRSADYVSTVTRVYREALDAVCDGSYGEDRFEAWEARLRKVFNRGFWQGGYYLGENMARWAESGNSQAEMQRIYSGQVSNFFQKPMVVEFTVKSDNLCSGETLLFTGPTTGAEEVVVQKFRVDDRDVEKVLKGQIVTLALPFKVRRQDKVFVLRQRNSQPAVGTSS